MVCCTGCSRSTQQCSMIAKRGRGSRRREWEEKEGRKDSISIGGDVRDEGNEGR